MCRRFLCSLGLWCAAAGSAFAQNAADTLNVVNWNLEWWADGSTHYAPTQVRYTEALMNAIGADVYALEEVVNVDSLAAVSRRLQRGPWAAVVSPYGSAAASPASSSYAGAQKLALLYRTAVFRNVSSRAFLKGNPYAYSDFASGRYPFLVSGELKGIDGIWRAVSFIVLHAKAQSDDNSCARRTSGAVTLKDSLDSGMPYNRFLLLGDFNDDLKGTICTAGGVSAYKPFVDDSSDAVSYRSLTLPLSRAGVSSVNGYSGMIDHVIASDEMAAYYVPGSAQVLRTFVRSVVPSYSNDVSDHYPVRTRYVLNGRGLGTSAPAQPVVQLFPNPAQDAVMLTGPAGPAAYAVYDATGRPVEAGAASFPIRLEVRSWAPGVYAVEVREGNGRAQTLRFVKLP